MEQPAFPTYAHPIEGITNRCYKCPPGYRINSEITEWDKCDISKTYPKTWPECLPCPDGYYSTEWSKDSFCIPQVRCDGKHELTEFAGTTSQRGLCICEPGYARIHDECVAISDTVLSTTIKPSNQYLPTCPPPTVCPPCPSTTISALLNQNTKGRSLDITPEYSQSQCNQDTVYIAIICALCCIIIVLVLYILKVKNKSAFKCGRKGNMEKKNRSIGQCDYAMVRQPTDDTPKKPVQGPAQGMCLPEQ
uniref:TNFR-Cys domain-containing protein n=1 Tax=Ciona intestinalis TaxID=7719 RepID=F6XM57_CIOIN